MTKLNFTPAFRKLGRTISKHRPAIMVGIGIGGMFAGAVAAVKITPKALRLIEESEREKGEDLTKIETAKVTWKCYILPATVEIASAICIIAGSREQYKRHTAIAAAYAMSETALKSCVDRMREVVTPEQFEEIKDKMAEDAVKKHPEKIKEVIVTGNGDVVCYDPTTGRTFPSNVEKLRRAENELNRRMRMENVITLNDYYDEVGLDRTSTGDMIGWDIDKGYIEMDFSSKLTASGVPCIVVQFWNPPIYLR